MRRICFHHGRSARRQGVLSPWLVVMLSPGLVLFVLPGLWLSREAGPEQLLREGHRAAARGDYQTAASRYEQAELHSINPAEVAYYLADARYRLAVKKEGTTSELLEAEQLYRCCLQPDDPRRPRALCGLGNCLLYRAGTRDESSLRAALACYDLCLQSAGDDRELADDARYNREKARLLLQQFQPPTSNSSSDEQSNDEGHTPPKRPDRAQTEPAPVGDFSREGKNDPNAQPSRTKPEDSAPATKSDEPPPPGKGNLPPIPDEVDTPPLSPREAAEYLQQAAKKVLQERQIRHRRSDSNSASTVKDW